MCNQAAALNIGPTKRLVQTGMASQPRISLAAICQNRALNIDIAEKGFPISVYKWTTSKVDETVEHASKEGNQLGFVFHDPELFFWSIQKPQVIIMLVKAGSPVVQTIKTLSAYVEKGDRMIDGGEAFVKNFTSCLLNGKKGELLSFLIEITADINGQFIAAPTTASSLAVRFVSGSEEERVEPAKVFKFSYFSTISTEHHLN
ncbi:6-phosphogluconate dehydrogenase, NADP-binding [Dillenia turbinata]|uniref:6-phosphogluconate dehydrogenase, NADP-binding n=1 Tax=Dillenia turbinata TaxID=194707 RepID=A0AAN8Z600_9MAGN